MGRASRLTRRLIRIEFRRVNRDVGPVNLLAGKKWFSWTRLLGVAGTVALLWVAFRKIEFGSFSEAVRRTHPGGCALAFGIYGVALAVQADRWHLALRAVRRAVHVLATWRLAMIGHFFFTVFFGVAGGDAAKSALYARWFGFPFPEVIAAAPLDRGLSLAGAIVLALVTWGLAVGSGGMEALRDLPMQGPGVWVLAGLVMAAGAGGAVVFWRPRGDSAWARTVRAFREGGGRVVLRPRLAAGGLTVATLGHICLSAVFAMNLLAVAGKPIPWAQLAWTIPAITTISCLPFTLAGAGVREVAAVSLLGLYGVPAGDCVAAAMWTMVHKLAWAGVGAGVLWREQALQEAHGPAGVPTAEETELSTGRRQHHGVTAAQSISIVMPILNETESLPETIRRARANPEVCEIIVVDGGSQDNSGAVAERLGCRVLGSAPGRGGQMRLGASLARGDVVLFLHADTWLPPDAARKALDCLRDLSVVAGGFWKVFRDSPFLLLGARCKCGVRLLLGRRILGDQAMFVRREVLEKIGGVPEMELMEEFELCRRLRRVGRLALADATVTTSARRFVRLGVVRTYLRMGWVTLRYRLGAAPRDLRRMYEKE
jgi:rSAM/selenodomain-associated transferase 2